MPLNSGSKRPASRACNGPARSAIHDASSAGSAHVAILGPPVNDGARMQTPSWPKGLFHAKINSDQKDSEHSFFQKVQTYRPHGTYKTYSITHHSPRFKESSIMWVPKWQRDRQKGVDSPVPTQVVSNEEFIPRPQNDQQQQVEHLIGELGEAKAKKLGMDRRAFMA